MDNILRTIYILDFIDDVELRQSVQKALNRGEAYHRFRRAVAFINGGKFKVQTETEQQVWNDCARLIANAVIYYNTALLSKVYEQKVAAGDLDAIAFIQGMSPVAWQHVNMFGSFEFSDEAPDIDMEALAARYADAAFLEQRHTTWPTRPFLTDICPALRGEIRSFYLFEGMGSFSGLWGCKPNPDEGEPF